MSAGSSASLPSASSVVMDAWEYGFDAWQRTILFWDTLCRRGDNALRRQQEGSPPLLHYGYERILDGRTLPRPANYALLKIVPDARAPSDARKRPFIIIDPRAGHGPGIGGFKEDSEIGMALRAGHPVYFVSFYPRPVAGQTLGDVSAAEAAFVEEVARRHPDADKPCIIGNCQAGWAVATLAAVQPEIMGPLILSGAPLAYWSGVSGKNPLRYFAGLMGGKWLESLAGDLGNGLFDGAHLVANFESLNPANTFWTKWYNLYSNVDTEAQRFLEFEAWWTEYFLVNAEEMDTIVSELFIGNRLTRGEVSTTAGKAVDLANIRSPVVLFASWGDNITPPQQALNWIEDVYGTEQAIVDSGRVVVYLLHEDIGHLGIFVSGRVARKEYAQLVDTLEMIDSLPPGLYQMLIKPGTPVSGWEEFDGKRYRVRFEARTMNDLRALDDTRLDERYFPVVDTVSRLTDALYRLWLSPWIRGLASELSAELLRQGHPLRMQRRMLSGLNPLLAAASWWAPAVRQQRRAASENNIFRWWEAMVAATMAATLDIGREVRDEWYETVFKLAYGPLGFGALVSPEPVRQRSPRGPAAAAAVGDAELRSGGALAAILRIVAAAGLDGGVFDRRALVILRALLSQSAFQDMTATELKGLFRQQAAILRREPDRATSALRDMLLEDQTREDVIRAVQETLSVIPEAAALGGPLGLRIREALGMGPAPHAAY